MGGTGDAVIAGMDGLCGHDQVWTRAGVDRDVGACPSGARDGRVVMHLDDKPVLRRLTRC